MIEAVLFDMDGILIDSEREYDKAMREAITRYGHIITDEFLLRVRGIPVEAFKKSLKLEFGRDFPVLSPTAIGSSLGAIPLAEV